MGTTAHRASSTEDALRAEFMLDEVVDRQGNWTIALSTDGTPGLYHTKMSRSGDRVYCKTLHVADGLGVRVPRRIAAAYMALHGWDYTRAGGEYGADALRRATS